MQSKIGILETKLRIKKMDAHRDEMMIQKLKLLEKAAKLDSEIDTATKQIEELENKLNIQGQGE